jgi:hypothetical protein
MNMDLLLNGLKEVPQHALWLLAFMVAFGVYWKKSRWPNRLFPYVNLAVSTVLYPLFELSLSDEPYHLYRHPLVVLGLAGAAVALATVFLHNGIVIAIKKTCPWIDFPEDVEPDAPRSAGVPPAATSEPPKPNEPPKI